MADISRYKGGAARNQQRAKPRQAPRTLNQVAAPRYDDTVISERRATAQEGNDRTRYTPEQNANDGEVFDLRTGSFTEEIPIRAPEEGRSRLTVPRPRANVRGNEVELDGDRVRVTRRFAKGGQIRAQTGDFVEMNPNGPKRRVSAAEVNAQIRGTQPPPRRTKGRRGG